MLAEGLLCGLHRIERLMWLQALKARPRRRRLPPDLGERQVAVARKIAVILHCIWVDGTAFEWGKAQAV
jgi:hypothetical protein